MKWYENKPEDLELVMKNGTTYDVLYTEYVPAWKSSLWEGNQNYPENRLVYYKKNKDDIVPSCYGGFNDMGWRDDCIVRVKEKQTIDWSKPLEVKVWNCEDIITGSTNGWVDVIETRIANAYNCYGKPYYKNVYYINSNGRTEFFHFHEDGYCRTGKEQKIFGKVRNKKETKTILQEPVTTDVQELFNFLFAPIKDSNGKEIKVPKGNIKESLKNPDKIRKNNIVIEKFSDKVVVKEINLMSAGEIYDTYGKEVHSEYFWTVNKKSMHLNESGLFWVYSFDVIKNIDEYNFSVGDSFSHSEWNKIWSDIKECGERLSTIIKANKKSQEGKKEVLYV